MVVSFLEIDLQDTLETEKLKRIVAAGGTWAGGECGGIFEDLGGSLPPVRNGRDPGAAILIKKPEFRLRQPTATQLAQWAFDIHTLTK